jgi:cobyrinic acid a,c-diamide synthase
MAKHEFLISAAHKSSGKTTLSIGLIRALRALGLSVQPGKKGPDYIDPMWLSSAAQRPCYNYDFNTQTPTEISDSFAASDADVRLIEGNKGLYDSIDVEGRFSNAALARLLGIPVVLVLDAEGITRGIAPLLCGYRDFEKVDIAGVILNKVASGRHEAKLRAAIGHYTDIPVLGAMARDPDLRIIERHLGLVPSNEQADSRSIIELIANAVARQVDLEALLQATGCRTSRNPPQVREECWSGEGIRLAVARDEAFGFYYADDLDTLTRAGVRLNFFSPVHDATLPVCDGVFIGGGFPESFAGKLSANRTMLEGIRAYCAAGGPVYAECGGLMYLCDELHVGDSRYSMAGVIPATVAMQDRPAGRGLVKARADADHPWSIGNGSSAGSEVCAHEFHFSRIIEMPVGVRYAYRMLRGQGIDGRSDGIVVGNTLATYLHQRHTQSNPWLRGFVEFIQKCKSRSQSCP